MPDPSTVALFVTAALVLVVVPGPNILYIVARGVHQGRTAGLVSALGVEAGTLLHVAAATLGLSALLASSAVAFSAVKYLGAAYLLYLGVRTLLDRGEDWRVAPPAPARLGRIFSQGVLVNLLNPKTALFFLAFMPQFVDPTRGSVATQTLFFGILLAALGLCSDALYALLGGGLGARLTGNRRLLAAKRWVTATVYLGLGATTALTGAETRK